jgi:hypothetical protein
MAAAAPMLQADPAVSNIGSYRLFWDAGTAGAVARYELQEASGPEFAQARSIYRGPDQSTVMSGRGDGTYYYRLRVLGADAMPAWSETIQVEVRHHPLVRAFAFFAAGALVFVATLVLIVAGSRARKR